MNINCFPFIFLPLDSLGDQIISYSTSYDKHMDRAWGPWYF